MKPLDNLVYIGKLKAESLSRVECDGLPWSGRASDRVHNLTSNGNAEDGCA